jgi:hypothetical protein
MALRFLSRPLKSMGSLGSSSPPSSSSSLSRVMQLPMLGLMTETDELRLRTGSRRVPAKRMPRLPSAHSESNSTSASAPGVFGAPGTSMAAGGGRSFRAPRPTAGTSKSSPQSSETSWRDLVLPRRLMEPPSRAEEGTLRGMGMPTLLADEMACDVEAASPGASSSCQSSSPATDSERVDRRDDRAACAAEPLDAAKRSPARSTSSSQFSTACIATGKSPRRAGQSRKIYRAGSKERP